MKKIMLGINHLNSHHLQFLGKFYRELVASCRLLDMLATKQLYCDSADVDETVHPKFQQSKKFRTI